MSDELLSEIVIDPPETIEDVIIALERIDAALNPGDGLKWFNLLYLMVTREVLARPPAAGWADPVWIARLDINFANLYFEALRVYIANPESAPKPWKVLFSARTNERIMRVQFALCGMNAHINRDLQFALVKTCAETNLIPRNNSLQHQDFEYINNILEIVEPKALEFLATGVIGVIEESLGRVDNILAMWSVKRARETGWFNAEILWRLRNNNFLRKRHIDIVDSLTSLAGRGLIIPA